MFCSGSSTSSIALARSPRKSAPILSISSIISTGCSSPRRAARDRARHRADVGAPVAADLGLVAHAADRHALELAPHRGRDRAPSDGLAHAGRSDEQDDRAARLGVQLPHGEELEDAVLHAVDVVVVGRAPRARASGRGCPPWTSTTAARPATRGSCGSRRAPPTAAAGARSGRARAARPSPISSGSACSSCSRSSSASACCSSTSPSSSWIARSCWRRKNSRWPRSISVWTWLWILLPISTSSSSRARISDSSVSAS